MKKSVLVLIACFFTIAVNAQPSHLQENFDASCAVSSGHPGGWQVYNPVPGTSAQGAWTCTSTEGRPSSTSAATPGMMCTSVYGSPVAYNLDTSYLITPLLYLASYAPGHVYLHFDSKVSKINLSGDLHVIESADSNFHIATDTDITLAAFPVIGPGDSSAWVTHELDLQVFETSSPFYIAFRYTGSTTAGSIWYLDNVNISATRLYTEEMNINKLPLAVVGRSTSSQITISFSTRQAGACHLGIYDMLGKAVHDEKLQSKGGFETHTINNLHLQPGMYCIKMGNEASYGFAKTIVE